MRNVKPTTVRFTDEDKALIVELKQRFGLTSIVQVLRLALRMLKESRPERGTERGESETP
jgi:hypothetical protein